MSSLKGYFVTRVGKALPWSLEMGSTRHGEPHRRDYEVTVRGVDGDLLVATVESADFDRDGKRVTRGMRDHGIVRVPLKAATNPQEALEDAAREADPTAFAKHPRAPRGPDPAAARDGIEQRLKALDDPAARGKDEGAPHPASVARFRKFWSSSPNLALPELFSSKDGTVRARWQDGHERTLWISFPEKGSLGWTAQVPRQGGYGLRKMNARCADDQDIIPMATLLGIRCTR